MSQDLLSQKRLVDQYLQKTSFSLSSFSFVNIFAWKDFFTFDFQIINGNLCVFAKNELGCFLYLPPLGERGAKESVVKAMDFCRKENKYPGVARVENIEEDKREIFSSQDFCFQKRSDEFVYKRQDIACLSGNRFKSKRSSCNQFLKEGSPKFCAYESFMLEECIKLYAAWAEDRLSVSTDDIYRAMIIENRKVHQEVLKYYQELDLVGRVVLVDKKIVAYSFGFVLRADTFCILFEIAHPQYKSAATYIFQKFCSDKETEKFSYVNVMDDFGMENIRKTKLSFHPYKTVSSYTACPIEKKK